VSSAQSRPASFWWVVRTIAHKFSLLYLFEINWHSRRSLSFPAIATPHRARRIQSVLRFEWFPMNAALRDNAIIAVSDVYGAKAFSPKVHL
jgi:hypothetical protein